MPSRLANVIAEELGMGVIPLRLRFALAVAALLPYRSYSRLRPVIYRAGGIKIDRGATVHGRLHVIGCSAISIGSFTRIGGHCRMDATAPITIGQQVSIAPDVSIITTSHQIGDRSRRAGKVVAEAVVVQDGAWVGANAMLMPGVTIGTGSVVGAGAVVQDDVPPNTIVAGSPARPVRSLDEAREPSLC
jgi:acetyltransferase-like isoleucine patch superfamily enzyme